MAVVPALEQGPEARTQRRQLAREQARTQRVEQVVDFEQRIDLGRAEPDTRKFREFGARIEDVGLALSRPDDRHVEAVAQVFDVALESGVRNLEVFLDLAPRQRAFLDQPAPDAIETLGPVHDSAGRHDAENLARILVGHEVERTVGPFADVAHALAD